MKKNIYFLLFILTLFFSACKKEDFRYETEFERSFGKWVSFKEKVGNSYSYVVYNSSWVGTSWQTEITVTNGKVTKRSFKLSTPGSGTIPPEEKEWTEKENEINSHQFSGAEPLTLDQVYEKARTDWLIKRKNATTYFEAENDGLLSSCGYIEEGCQDDCFVGINITSITP